MVSHVTTVAFQGIEGVPVDVQVQIAPGLPKFIIVGLPDKAVAESGERVRGALHASTTTRRSSPDRCSTGSTSASKSRRYRRPT